MVHVDLQQENVENSCYVLASTIVQSKSLLYHMIYFNNNENWEY